MAVAQLAEQGLESPKGGGFESHASTKRHVQQLGLAKVVKAGNGKFHYVSSNLASIVPCLLKKITRKGDR